MARALSGLWKRGFSSSAAADPGKKRIRDVADKRQRRQSVLPSRCRPCRLSLGAQLPALPFIQHVAPSFLSLAVYVVFGATGGIGSTLSQQLAGQPGARLLLSGRDDAKLAATAERAAAGSSAAVGTAAADPLDPAAVEKVLAEAVARYGRVDGVANCVGSVLLKSGEGQPPQHPPVALDRQAVQLAWMPASSYTTRGNPQAARHAGRLNARPRLAVSAASLDTACHLRAAGQRAAWLPPSRAPPPPLSLPRSRRSPCHQPSGV